MKVLAVILPVLTMIILGFACRKTGEISKDCVNGLKFLASKVMLPVSVFHALATASLDGGTVIPEIIILAMLVLTFGAGFFMRRFMKEPYKRYILFMVCVYEGGMLAYPLYTSICGMENLAHIAILDIAGILFGFSGRRYLSCHQGYGHIRTVCIDPLYVSTWIVCDPFLCKE